MRELASGIHLIIPYAGGRFLIQAPFNGEFVVRAHTLEGRWRPRSAAWSFPKIRKAAVFQAINEVYGTSIDLGTKL